MTKPHLTLMVITDGRWDCLEPTMQAMFDQGIMADGVFDHWMVVNDSLDSHYGELIDSIYAFDQHLTNDGAKWGFGGAIQAGWSALPDETEFVFHLEDDFVVQRHFDVEELANVLIHNPHLIQLALKRQPWNAIEKAAGGIVECWPDAYREMSDGKGNCWLEHRLFFTTNPSLYRRDLTNLGWPSGAQSEGRFTQRVLRDLQAQFAFWGERSDPPWVHHIGENRVGVGY